MEVSDNMCEIGFKTMRNTEAWKDGWIVSVEACGEFESLDMHQRMSILIGTSSWWNPSSGKFRLHDETAAYFLTCHSERFVMSCCERWKLMDILAKL